MAKTNVRMAGDKFNISDPEDFQVKKLKNFDLAARGAGSSKGTERLSKMDLKGLHEVGGFTKQELIDYAARIDPDPGASGGKAQKLLNKWKAELAGGSKPEAEFPGETTDYAPGASTGPAPKDEGGFPGSVTNYAPGASAPEPKPDRKPRPEPRPERPIKEGNNNATGPGSNSGNASGYGVINTGSGQAQSGRIGANSLNASADINVERSSVGGNVINNGIAVNNSQAFTQSQGGSPDTRATDSSRFGVDMLAALQASRGSYSDYGARDRTFTPPPSLDGERLSAYTEGFGHMHRDRAALANAGLRFN